MHRQRSIRKDDIKKLAIAVRVLQNTENLVISRSRDLGTLRIYDGDGKDDA